MHKETMLEALKRLAAARLLVAAEAGQRHPQKCVDAAFQLASEAERVALLLQQEFEFGDLIPLIVRELPDSAKAIKNLARFVIGQAGSAIQITLEEDPDGKSAITLMIGWLEIPVRKLKFKVVVWGKETPKAPAEIWATRIGDAIGQEVKTYFPESFED